MRAGGIARVLVAATAAALMAIAWNRTATERALFVTGIENQYIEPRWVPIAASGLLAIFALVICFDLVTWIARGFRQSRSRYPHVCPQKHPKAVASELSSDDYRDLSRTIVLFTQHGKAAWPQHDEEAVVAEFGEDRGKLLLDLIGIVLVEMLSIQVDWSKHNLVSAGDFVREEMRRRYFGLSEEALSALRWRFTFDNK